MTLDQILSRLEGVKRISRIPDGYTALCPAHDDHRNSLSVRQVNERILMHCFAGCTIEDICKSLQINTKDLYNNGGKSLAVKSQVGKDTIVATYNYQDENGNLLFQVCRTINKRFFQRRPDGNGGFINGVEGIKPVLYRLPEILRAVQRGETVFIAEGEKDVDNLVRLGLTATTSPMGAGKWREHYNAWFKGANVVIFPDNDVPGHKHAEQVANSLYAVAAKVRIVNLPGLSHKGDVSDWIANGGGKDDLLRLVESTAAYEPKIEPEEAEHSKAFADNTLQKDYGHAALLAEFFKNQYRWAVHRGNWMRYQDGVWRPVPEEAVAKEAADRLRQHYANELASTTDKTAVIELTKKITETCTYARIIGALSFLKGWDGVLTLAEEWDHDHWLLNVKNGTIDLKTCTFKPHDPGDLLTKQAPVEYDPDAKSIHWLQHIEMFLPDPAIRRQVQRDLGGALPGVVLEEALPIWWGTGGNGKTTTLMTILRILGDYACRAAPDLLVQSKYSRHPTEIADLFGIRLAFSVEMDKAEHLAEALVKDLTGGDRKKARFIGKDFFQFDPTFSLVLVCNQKPIVTGTDNGLWRRLRLIPWNQQVDPKVRREQEAVISELVSEASAILNWLLDGLRDRQREPWWIADKVKAVTESYKAEMDLLAGFLEERCVLNPRATVPKSELYVEYESWCEKNHERPVSKKALTRMLEERGIGEGREGHEGTRVYVGIGLLSDRELLTHADSFSS